MNKKALSVLVLICIVAAGFWYRYTQNSLSSFLKEVKANYAYQNIKEGMPLQFESLEWAPLRKKFQSIHDAHLEVRPLNQNYYYSQIRLDLNAKYVVGHGELTHIDGVPIDEWIMKHESLVFYSSAWARDYRTLKLLESYPSDLEDRPRSINVLQNEKKVDVDLIWSKSQAKEKSCVSYEDLNESIRIIKVHSFWCDSGNPNLSREEVFANFKSSLDSSFQNYEGDCILDLRGNSGGGDQEVRYLLTHFIEKEVFLYRFRAFNEKEDTTDFLKPDSKLKRKGRMVTLIDSGCASSCEVVASVLKENNISALIGYQTHGTAGDPKTVVIDKWVLSYPTAMVWQQSGELYEGIGVTPDLPAIFERPEDWLNMAIKQLQLKN